MTNALTFDAQARDAQRAAQDQLPALETIEAHWQSLFSAAAACYFEEKTDGMTETLPLFEAEATRLLQHLRQARAAAARSVANDW